MKKRIGLIIVFILLMAVAVSCSNESKNKNLIIGKWKCELYSSDLVIEFAENGNFIDHTSYAENKYRLEGGCVVIYVEDMPETEVKINFEVSENKLVLGELEYTRIGNELSEYDKNGKSFPEYSEKMGE